MALPSKHDNPDVLLFMGGMSMRDYFAAAALQGYIASWPQDGASMVERTDKVSMMCFKFADAMLAERMKRNDA
jgi:hypothetical protein